ncbi:MAG: MATE family efflux transporter [Steroidobacteraceae bacterium]
MRHVDTALVSGPVPRTLLRFALPILYANVLQSVNGSINSVWVGKFLGEAALTATANANILMFLLLGAVFGLTMAATILIAQHIGAGNAAEARRVVGSSAGFFLAVSAVIGVVGLVLAGDILALMRTPDEALPLARSYLQVLFLALPFSFMFFFVMAVLRGAGDAKTPFYFMALAVLLDIVLNPLLIFGFGPVPGLKIAGSALATLLSQAISLAMMLRAMRRRGSVVWLHRNELHLLRPVAAIINTLLRKGLPMGLQMIVLSSSMVAMIALINRFGTVVTAAFAAGMQVWVYVQMPAFALGAAVSSMAAQNIGAGQWNRVAEIARSAVLFNLLLTGIPVIMLLALARPALGLFLPGDVVTLDVAQKINAIVLWSYPLFGIAMVLNGVIRATGAVIAPLVVLFVSLWLVRIPGAYYLADQFGHRAMWWSFPVAAALAATATVIYYRFGSWRKARLLPQASHPVDSP